MTCATPTAGTLYSTELEARREVERIDGSGCAAPAPTPMARRLRMSRRSNDVDVESSRRALHGQPPVLPASTSHGRDER